MAALFDKKIVLSSIAAAVVSFFLIEAIKKGMQDGR